MGSSRSPSSSLGSRATGSQLASRSGSIQLYQTLLDTGSAGTLVSTDRLLEIGLQYEPNDPIYRIYGVGGSEFVFAKRIDQLTIGDLSLSHFEVEQGSADSRLQ